MSGLFWGPFLLINFVPLNGLYFPVSLYAFWFVVVVEHWTLEYNVITLEIRVLLSHCLKLKQKIFKAIAIHLFNDFSKLFLRRLYSLLCIVTEISIPLVSVN